MTRGKLFAVLWDRIAAWACVALGAVVLLLGWVGISDKPLAAEQLPYILSGGLGGIFLLGLGATLWLSADLRDEWSKLDRIEEVLRGQHIEAEEARGVAVARSNGARLESDSDRPAARRPSKAAQR